MELKPEEGCPMNYVSQMKQFLIYLTELCAIYLIDTTETRHWLELLLHKKETLLSNIHFVMNGIKCFQKYHCVQKALVYIWIPLISNFQKSRNSRVKWSKSHVGPLFVCYYVEGRDRSVHWPVIIYVRFDTAFTNRR